MALILNSLIALFLTALPFTLSDDNYESAKILLEKYIENATKYINPRYRPLYHVAPPVGWMNDPNGFSYYKGEYHVFYQFYPYSSEWGPMHWGHSSSPDLVNWKRLPTALLPEKEQIFSGGAMIQGNTMILMYTGHVVIDENNYKQGQYLAFSDDGINYLKYEGNPVIPQPPNGSPDFRDPKVWQHGDEYYVIIGSKTTDNRGNVLLYKSKDMKSWQYLTVLGESTGEMGYMWECPDFFELDGRFVLLMSPQGMEAKGDRYKNLYQNGYFIGKFSYETNVFTPEVAFQEMDYGHDIYAATTTEVNGKRHVVAWFNMWEVNHPEAADGWSGAMTIARELSIVNNRILMKPPVEAITSLRNGTAVDGIFSSNAELEFGKAVELIIVSDLNQKVDLFLTGTEGGGNVSLQWDPAVRKVVVDRFGDVRQVEWTPISSHTWRIFLDASTLELFCGEGEVVFSSRVFPTGGWKLTNRSPQTVNVKAYNLKQMNSPSPKTENKSPKLTLHRFCYLIITFIFTIKLLF